ncbi:MAG: amidase [Anaerolineales bacterium]|nr:amidase [Anaerolineales bacterium]
MSLLERSLPELVKGLCNGSVDLLGYLAELEAHFVAREPAVLAFVPEPGRWERVRAEAAALLAEYPEPEMRPVLFGLPIGVKDIFNVAGMTTRAGSQLPAADLQGTEASSVTRLKAAGAIVLGKTVTTEFAYFAPGPTRNPHNPAHTPGGSSSGSAAAVGAALVPFAFGTQTIGSINRPAAYCGVVGYKPSSGRIARDGVIPLSDSLDHIGYFTRRVSGTSLMAPILCSDWDWTAEDEGKPVLGIPQGPYLNEAWPEGLAHFQATVEQLQAAGYLVKPVPAMADFPTIRQEHVNLMSAEAARFHAPWLTQYRDQYHFKTVAMLEAGEALGDEAIATGQARQAGLRAELEELMAQHEIDFWIAPAAQGPAPAGLDATGDPVMNLPWTCSGLPSLTIPTGINNEGLPLGLQLVGKHGYDEELMVYGQQLDDLLSIHG